MERAAGAQRSGMSPLYQVLAEDIVAMGVEAVFGLRSDDILACGNPARPDLGGGRSVTTRRVDTIASNLWSSAERPLNVHNGRGWDQLTRQREEPGDETTTFRL
jgi:hypothetical protein